MDVRGMKQALDAERQRGKMAEAALEALKVAETADAIKVQVDTLRQVYDETAAKLGAIREEVKAADAELVRVKGEAVNAQLKRDSFVSGAKAEQRELEAVSSELQERVARDRATAVEVYNARVELERVVRELETRKARLEEAIAVLKNG